MQDRFKFRVWNKLSNTMTYNFMFGNFMQKSLEDYEKKDWVGLNYEPNYICFNNKAIEENLVIMQCTGLKDKNGKLIYEGDILNYSCLAGYSDIYTCTFNNGSFLIGGLLISNTHLKSEVIGNIYENPKLLEAEQCIFMA